MPILYTPNHKLQILHTVSHGTVTSDEIAYYQKTAWLDPALFGYNELYDLTDSDYSKINFSDLFKISKTASKLYMLDPNSKFAFLTGNTYHEQLADFYITAKELTPGPSRSIKKFTNRDDAMQWLTTKS